MENKILEAIEEMEGIKFKSIEQAKERYSAKELLDIWLKYEGIQGYTHQIMRAIEIIS